jgi:membrane protein implicated in regulation of membrane protease activity
MGGEGVWFWFWVITASGLILGEVFTATFFMAAFGLGASVAATFTWHGAEPAWQVGIFLVVSVPLLFLARAIAARQRSDIVDPVAGDRMVGAAGVVTESLRPHQPGGKVRVGTEEWAASTEDGAALDKGVEVNVVKIEGVRLVVRPRTV